MSLTRRGNNINIYCSFIVWIWTDNTIANLEQTDGFTNRWCGTKKIHCKYNNNNFYNGDFFRNRSVVPKIKKMLVVKLTSPTLTQGLYYF